MHFFILHFAFDILHFGFRALAKPELKNVECRMKNEELRGGGVRDFVNSCSALPGGRA